MKDYIITTSGDFVAGVRNPGKGKFIKLTDLQAAHPLRLGHIALKAAKEKGSKEIGE